MPYGDDPSGVVQLAIEESIGFDDDFAVREIRKLWNLPTGIREPFEASENLLGAASEASSRLDVVNADIGDGRQKLRTPGRCEPDARRSLPVE